MIATISLLAKSLSFGLSAFKLLHKSGDALEKTYEADSKKVSSLIIGFAPSYISWLQPSEFLFVIEPGIAHTSLLYFIAQSAVEKVPDFIPASMINVTLLKAAISLFLFKKVCLSGR